MRSPTSRLFALALALALPLSACDDGTGPEESLARGEFEGRVSGHFTQDLAGQAYFTEGDEGSAILLYDVNVSGNAGQAIGLLRYDQEPFLRGTFPIADYRGDDFPLDEYLGVFATFQPVGGEVEERMFVSTGGTMNITSVESDAVSGRLTFNAVEEIETASGDLVTGTATVRVTASFRAERCDLDCEPGSLNRLPASMRARLESVRF